jgi:hypothetical protein
LALGRHRPTFTLQTPDRLSSSFALSQVTYNIKDRLPGPRVRVGQIPRLSAATQTAGTKRSWFSGAQRGFLHQHSAIRSKKQPGALHWTAGNDSLPCSTVTGRAAFFLVYRKASWLSENKITVIDLEDFF